MTPAGLAVMLMFLLVGTIGFFLTVYSLWRSLAVPRAAVIVMLCGFIADAFLNLQLAGQLLGFVASAWIALTLLLFRPSTAAARVPVEVTRQT